MKQKPSAFSKDNLLFTIPRFVYLGITIVQIGFSLINPINSIPAGMFSPMLFLWSGLAGEIYTGWEYAWGSLQLQALPLCLLALFILYCIAPKKWVKIATVIMMLVDFLSVIVLAVILRGTWLSPLWQTATYVAVNSLLLTPMILHLIWTRKKVSPVHPTKPADFAGIPKAKLPSLTPNP
ncbi:MAG: hypothetical protein FWE69_06690 [Clostridiales bacterium]|nr:hypothetical protein [Clostridiales bacterium]